jgi:hypothetical protein
MQARTAQTAYSIASLIASGCSENFRAAASASQTLQVAYSVSPREIISSTTAGVAVVQISSTSFTVLATRAALLIRPRKAPDKLLSQRAAAGVPSLYVLSALDALKAKMASEPFSR